jgi:hypothetical protein
MRADESDEFPIWLGENDGWERSPGSFVERLRQLTPVEAANLLASEKSARIDLIDAWRTLCEDKPPTIAILTMKSLLERKTYEPDIWRMAFSVFWGRPESEWQPEVWQRLLDIIPELTDDLCSTINNTLSGWLSVLAKHLPMEEEPKFWLIWTRLWGLRSEAPEQGLSNRPVYAALNHPSGQLAEAALTRLFKRKLSKDDGLPAELKSYFDRIATAEDSNGILGRVILASRLNNLYLLDRLWTSDELIPKLEWSSPEASALWEGYLWAPRCSPELLAAFKKSFLETVGRSNEFGEHSTNLRRLFAAVCIYDDGALTPQEVRKAIHSFESKGLADLLALFSDLLRGAGEKAPTLWSDRVGPWLKSYWPTTKEKQSGRTSLLATEMAINGKDAFPQVAEWAMDFLLPSEHVDQVIWRLRESDVAERYPSIVLRVLSKLAPDNAENWVYHGLKEIMQKIASASPELQAEATYKRLQALAQKSS